MAYGVQPEWHIPLDPLAEACAAEAGWLARLAVNLAHVSGAIFWERRSIPHGSM